LTIACVRWGTIQASAVGDRRRDHHHLQRRDLEPALADADPAEIGTAGDRQVARTLL